MIQHRPHDRERANPVDWDAISAPVTPLGTFRRDRGHSTPASLTLPDFDYGAAWIERADYPDDTDVKRYTLALCCVHQIDPLARTTVGADERLDAAAIRLLFDLAHTGLVDDCRRQEEAPLPPLWVYAYHGPDHRACTECRQFHPYLTYDHRYPFACERPDQAPNPDWHPERPPAGLWVWVSRERWRPSVLRLEATGPKPSIWVDQERDPVYHADPGTGSVQVPISY